MKISYLIILLVAFISCKSHQTETAGYGQYGETFEELKQLLIKEQFWGKQLYGPIMLIDPATRQIIANQNNSSNDLVQQGKVFLGNLPENINIANTAFDWKGQRWTMVILPLPEDDFQEKKLLVHELFHRVQPDLNMKFNEVANDHLDTFEGRLLLLLELEALKNALTAESNILRENHLKNALTFRNLRQKNEDLKTAENSLEMNEGLAEYAGLKLAGKSEKQIKKHLVHSLNSFHENPTFVRSFAYRTIPAYGFLLSLKDENWHKEVTPQTILTDLFTTFFSLDIPEMSLEELAANYDYNYEEILEKEQIREKKRLERIAEFKKKFLDSPTLKLAFQNMNISFDPRNIVPLGNNGTVYPNIRVTDDWGVLEVKEGALLSSDWSNIKVTPPTDIGESVVKGQGWTLNLDEGWKVQKSDGDYSLVKK